VDILDQRPIGKTLVCLPERQILFNAGSVALCLFDPGALPPGGYTEPWVPPEATHIVLSCTQFRAGCRVDGYCDVCCLIYLANDLSRPHCKIAQLAGKLGLPNNPWPNGMVEDNGKTIIIPNKEFWWNIKGSTLDCGVDVTLPITSYYLP